MVVRLLKTFVRRSVVLVSVALVLQTSPIVKAAEDYSACTYSSGDYSHTADCEDQQTTSNGALPGTGESQKQILFLAISLIAGITGVAGVLYFIKKARK